MVACDVVVCDVVVCDVVVCVNGYNILYDS